MLAVGLKILLTKYYVDIYSEENFYTRLWSHLTCHPNHITTTMKEKNTQREVTTIIMREKHTVAEGYSR